MTEKLENFMPTILEEILLRKYHFTVLEVYKGPLSLTIANILFFFLKKHIKLRSMKSYLLTAHNRLGNHTGFITRWNNFILPDGSVWKVSSVAEFVVFATTICCICTVFATKLVTSYMKNDSLH